MTLRMLDTNSVSYLIKDLITSDHAFNQVPKLRLEDWTV